jgi:two-component system NtrC family response regulator
VKVLLADDEVTITMTLSDALKDAGHEVFVATDTDSALRLLVEAEPEAVLTDIRMPGAGGMAVLARSMELDPQRPVIIMTGFASLEQAQEAVELGASLFVQKPFRNEALVSMVETCGRLRDLEDENEVLRKRLEGSEGFEGVVGTSPAMRAVFERVRTVAPTEATVLIEGESGTGKERIARAIHELSGRSQGPFVALSCAALPETLLEAELFGHERGAFTDARKDRKGRFELADGGTFFLDDIDDMPLGVQVKLLRVLQERCIERLGGEGSIDIDIRVLAATKAPLLELVREGRFREDLYYRIQVVPIELPPLRKREGDVPALFAHLLERHGGGRAYQVSSATMRALERYSWPGNVRELENAVQRAVALAGEREALVLEDLLPQDPRWRDAVDVSDEVRPLRVVVREAERRHLERALEATGGHRMQTAELLGISRKVLWEKLRDHELGKE